ncbi:hypothetical protein NMG60_11031965 [Bertholletia excelsa]
MKHVQTCSIRTVQITTSPSLHPNNCRENHYLRYPSFPICSRKEVDTFLPSQFFAFLKLMSSLANKLKSTRKAWKSLTKALLSSLHKFVTSNTPQKTTLLLKPLPKLCRRHRCHYHSHQQLQLQKKSAAMYVNKLFPGHVAVQAKRVCAQKEARSAKEMGGTSGSRRGAAAATLPEFRGIDERAEEFICKYRDEMKLQMEQSIMDFQEILARSA